jgi:transcriptional regulator with XRE-family HTH domain
MPLDPQQVGQRLIEIRELQGRSLSEVAEAAGIAKSYLLKLERGEVENPGLATLDTVAKALKVTLAKLLAPSDKPGVNRSAGETAWESVEARMPESLKEFVRAREKQEKIPADIKRALAGIRFRGNQPERAEDWELIYLAVKRGVERG